MFIRKARKSLFVIVIVLSIVLNACNFVDKTVNAGIDQGFGNTQPCSGIVC